MEGEGRAIAYIVSVSILVGLMLGAIAINSRFQHDTYDCTVKCPNNSHSIYVDEKCYCEVK
jgi:hypothetical protein